jgi:hypothetical protein
MLRRPLLLCLFCAAAFGCTEEEADASDASVGMDAPVGTFCANDGLRCAVDQACCSVPPCEDTGWCYFWCCTPEPVAALAEAPPGMQCLDGGSDGYSLCCATGQEPCFIGSCSAGDHCRMTCCPAP